MSLEVLLKQASSNFPGQPPIVIKTSTGITFTAKVLALDNPALKVWRIDVYVNRVLIHLAVCII